jgi:plastocyanin
VIKSVTLLIFALLLSGGAAISIAATTAVGMGDPKLELKHEMKDEMQHEMQHEVQHEMSHGMSMDSNGIVMNSNNAELPWGCESISQDYAFEVRAGRNYALVPGMVFGMSQHAYNVAPCSRVTVTFSNEDEVRHQWMVHGLPNYLYPTGMFHLEAMAGKSVRGTFIVPGDDKTYLVHCDMAQHMEKGMKGQLKVGRGSGDLWSIPTVSDTYRRADYLPEFTLWMMALLSSVIFLVVLYIARKK